MTIQMASTLAPTAFISYAWDGEAYRSWIRELAVSLRQDGVNALLDQWEAVPGDLLPHFMESSVKKSDFVLVACTPKYKVKSEARAGGVGYEGDVITADLFNGASRRKFIPVLAVGSWAEAAPSWLSGAYYIDLRGDSWSTAQYQDLLSAIHGHREKAPPLGPGSRGMPLHAPFASSQAASLDSELLEMGLSWLRWNLGHPDWLVFLRQSLRMDPQDTRLRELGLDWLRMNTGHPDWTTVWQSMAGGGA